MDFKKTIDKLKNKNTSNTQSKVDNEKNYENAEVTDKLDVIGKNTMVLPMMHRDLNVIRQSIVKLVKLQGGTQKDKADRFFMRASTREDAYEAQFKKKEKPEQVSKDTKDKKSVFSDLFSGFMSAFGGGLVSLLIKGIGLMVFGEFIRDLITDKEFRNTVFEGIGNLFKAFKKFLFESEAGKSLLTGLLTIAGLVLAWKAAVALFTGALTALGARMAGMATGGATGSILSSLLTPQSLAVIVAAVGAATLLWFAKSNRNKAEQNIKDLDAPKGSTPEESKRNVEKAAKEKGLSTFEQISAGNILYEKEIVKQGPNRFTEDPGYWTKNKPKKKSDPSDEGLTNFQKFLKRIRGHATGASLVTKGPTPIGYGDIAGEKGPERITISPVDKPLEVIIKKDETKIDDTPFNFINQYQSGRQILTTNFSPSITPVSNPVTKPTAALVPQKGSGPKKMPVSNTSPTGKSNSSMIKENNLTMSNVGYNASKGLVTVKSKSGKTATVASQYAKNFQGFIDELEASGYKINDLQGYNNRPVRGDSVASYHASGAAIDINPSQNPVHGSKLITDMPKNISQIAAKHGLGWGGDWSSKKDPMHFSIAASEGGSEKIARSYSVGGASMGTQLAGLSGGSFGGFGGFSPGQLSNISFDSDSISKATKSMEAEKMMLEKDWMWGKTEEGRRLMNTRNETVKAPPIPPKQPQQNNQMLASASVTDTQYAELLQQGLWQRSFGTGY